MDLNRVRELEILLKVDQLAFTSEDGLFLDDFNVTNHLNITKDVAAFMNFHNLRFNKVNGYYTLWTHEFSVIPKHTYFLRLQNCATNHLDFSALDDKNGHNLHLPRDFYDCQLLSGIKFNAIIVDSITRLRNVSQILFNPHITYLGFTSGDEYNMSHYRQQMALLTDLMKQHLSLGRNIRQRDLPGFEQRLIQMNMEYLL